MVKIISLTGHKNTKKHMIAEDLSKNESVEYVTPYCDRELPFDVTSEMLGNEHYILPSRMDEMIENEKVISLVFINDHRYVFFGFQFKNPISVVIADDYQVLHFKDQWEGELFCVKCTSKYEEDSHRVGECLSDDEFNLVFDVENDDINQLEEIAL